MFGWKFQNKANQNPIKRLFTTIFYKSKNAKYFFLTYINVFNEICNYSAVGADESSNLK